MTPCKAVVFDIGNVLVRWDVSALYAPLFDDSAELDYFLSHVVTLEWHTEHDRGLPFAEGVRRLSAKFPQYADKIALFDSRWDDTIIGEIKPSVVVLRALKDKGVPLFGLTNFNGPKFNAFRNQYDFVSLFEDVLVSGDEKLVKPDPAIFRLALDRFGLTAGETLFIDDSAANIQAAKALGFEVHHFTDPDALPNDPRIQQLLK